MCVRVRPFWKTDFSALIKMSDQTRSSPPSSPSLFFACFLMWNSKQLQMYFLSGTHFAERLCPPLLCRVRWRRIVMTLALWDSKWAEFKCSLYITGPINQQRPVPGLQAEGAKKCAQCVFTCVHTCGCMLLTQMRVGGLARSTWRHGSKHQSLVRCRTACYSAYPPPPFCGYGRNQHLEWTVHVAHFRLSLGAETGEKELIGHVRRFIFWHL